MLLTADVSVSSTTNFQGACEYTQNVAIDQAQDQEFSLSSWSRSAAHDGIASQQASVSMQNKNDGYSSKFNLAMRMMHQRH